MTAALPPRLRLPYLATAVATMALGLASRCWPVLGTAPGDVLYASLLYWLLRACVPQRGRWLAAAGAFLLAAAVEVSQLWQPDWLLAMRATRVGGWMLGHSFGWADVGWYAVGAALALVSELAARAAARGRTVP